MPNEGLHAKLCSICYENQSKYRCPRCQAKTCSLPCTKKHKQRADCNGIRNPAEYLKRSQLATPVGIDRDYNYLKGVERSIDVANREREERGVDVVGVAATKSLTKARHPGSILRKYIVENRIHVRSAPSGMSRQKTNKTRNTKRHLIVWTIEWIEADGSKDVSDSCRENSTISELYALKQTGHINAMKRGPGEHSREASKRRRSAKQTLAQEEPISVKVDLGASDEPVESTTSASAVMEGAMHANLTQPIADLRQATATAPKIKEDFDMSLHFYLLKPGTGSKEKVLIALDRNATLTDCLRDRTVLEFPTIFVLPHEPTSLPADYLLEAQYLHLQKKEQDKTKDAAARAERKAAVEQARSAKASAGSGARVDVDSILNVLKRDMTR